MIGEEPFELEPEDAPRRPPSTVTIGRGDGTGVRQWRRRGLVLLGIVAVVAAMTIATRGDGDERAAPAESTTTSRSRTTTTQRSTTTSPPSTVGQLLGEPTGVTLVVQNDRGVDVVDLDTGKTRQLLGEFAPPPIAAIPAPHAGVVYTIGGEARFFPAPFDGRYTVVGEAEWVLRAAEPGRVWLVRTTEDGTGAVRATVDGAVDKTSGLEIPPPAYPVAAVEGGLLVEAFGRIYRMTSDGASPVTFGSTVAVSDRWLAVQGCDDALRCGLRLVDLVTGDERVVALPGALTAGYFTGSFSPDGSNLAVWAQSTSGTPRLLVIDTAAGQAEELPGASTSEWGNSPAWSPDGDWMFWVGSGVRAYDMRRGGEPFEIDLPGSGFYSVFAF